MDLQDQADRHQFVLGMALGIDKDRIPEYSFGELVALVTRQRIQLARIRAIADNDE